MSKILVIQNELGEGLGLFEDEIREAGFEWDTIKAFSNEKFPTGIEIDNSYKALIILGGSMSAMDEGIYPFLKDEMGLIRYALDRSLPILAICLGAQLLARVCGASLKLGGIKEAGWGKIRLVEWYASRNPLLFQLPMEFITFHWHTDTFDIPIEGYRLACSDLYPNQAFCYGGNAYGIQFHPEMTDSMMRNLVKGDRKKLDRFLNAAKEEEILSRMANQLPLQKELTHKIFHGFKSLIH